MHAGCRSEDRARLCFDRECRLPAVGRVVRLECRERIADRSNPRSVERDSRQRQGTGQGEALADFAAGRIACSSTKPSIAGFGLNWQHCARMASRWGSLTAESHLPAVRRCWRFGQKRDVHVHTFASSAEGAVVANLKRKGAMRWRWPSHSAPGDARRRRDATAVRGPSARQTPTTPRCPSRCRHLRRAAE